MKEKSTATLAREWRVGFHICGDGQMIAIGKSHVFLGNAERSICKRRVRDGTISVGDWIAQCANCNAAMLAGEKR